MTTISEIWNAIDHFLIRVIFVSVLVILLAKFLFKNKIDSEVSLRIIRTIFILHSVIYLITLITALLMNNSEGTFLARLRGPYWWAYWSMIFFNSVLPLTVVIKSLGNKGWYLLLVAVLMNIGWIMESLIIRTTAMNRNAMSPDYNPYLPTSYEAMVLIKGFILGILLLIIGYLYRWMKNQKRTYTN